jgi:hypothetical protein
MLIRIFLVVAIIGALAVVGLDVTMVKDKINTTLKQRDDFHKTADDETAQHKKFQKLAKDTQTKLDATNAMLVATMNERDNAVAVAAEKTKQAETLTATLQKTTEERDTAQNELAAWHALNVPIENIKTTLASLKSVTEKLEVTMAEKKLVDEALFKAQEKINFLTQDDYIVKEPAGLKGKVLAADPRYEFVVLDIGEKDHVVPDGKFIINRNGKLIAKVQIKSVQADRSIANIVPGWKLSDVMEGDQVLF